MRRGARFALAGVGLSLLLGYALLRQGLMTPLFTAALNRALARSGPYRVRMQSVRWDMAGRLEADGIVVLAPAGGGLLPLLSLGSLSIAYSPWDLLKGRAGWRESLRRVRLSRLCLFLLKGPYGWNLSTLGGGGAGGGVPTRPPSLDLLPRVRIAFDDCEVVLNDTRRSFRATLDRVGGSLDTRGAPVLRLAMAARTEGQAHRNLFLAAAWNPRVGSSRADLRLRGVAVARYLNYFLPLKGVHFTAGTASLRVLLVRPQTGPLRASGRAMLSGGALTLPDINRPLDAVRGRVDFTPRALLFRGVRAHFLGADWGASGAITALPHPRLDLSVSSTAVPLAALSRQVRGLSPLGLEGTAAVLGTVTGPARRVRIAARMLVPSLGIVGVRVESVSATAGLVGSRLRVRSLRGTLWGGEVEGRAAMDLARGGSLAADLTVTGALVQLAKLHGRPVAPFDGKAWGYVRASGPLRSPDLKAYVGVEGLRLGSWRLGDLSADAAYSRAVFQAVLFDREAGLHGTVGFGPGPGGPVAFRSTRIRLTDVDLGTLAGGLASAAPRLGLAPGVVGFLASGSRHLTATADAVCTVSGPLDAPTLWLRTRSSGRIFFREVPAGSPDPGMPFLEAGSVGLKGGSLLLGRRGKPLGLSVGPPSAGLAVTGLGAYPLGGKGAAGDLELGVGAHLSLLDATGFLKKSGGALQGALRMRGNLASPQVDGSLLLRGFHGRPTAYLAPFRDGQGEIQFRGQGVRLVHASFRAPGLVRLAGIADLSGGLDHPRGTLTVDTDAGGLRLQRWKGVGSATLRLVPLELALGGSGGAVLAKGTVVISDARIVYGGGAAGSSSSAAPASAPGSGPSRPIDLDLKVGLGNNVWYEKHRKAAVSLDLTDPARWLRRTIRSAESILLQPDISFRLAPSSRDFLVRGRVPDLDLRGKLEIDRGMISIMGNDFAITGDQGPAVIRFDGRHADVSGTAEARLAYSRPDATGTIRQRRVEVFAYIWPRSESELAAAGLEHSFLNYQVSFDSQPPIIVDNPELQKRAVQNLVVLGDPMVDIGNTSTTLLGNGPPAGTPAAAAAGSVGQGSLLANAGLGTLTTGLARTELNLLLRKFKILRAGESWLDVVSLSPTIRYQTVGAAPIQAQSAVSLQSGSSQAQSQYDIDWTLELGKSIGRRLYTSFKAVTFGQDARNSVIVASASNETVQSYGLRGGVEYQIGDHRSLDLYGDFGCDDNLNPVASNPQLPLQQPNIGYVVQLRDTFSTDNYSPQLADRRRWDLFGGREP